MRILFAPTADWHCNSVVGLYPQEFTIDGGQPVRPSKVQTALLKAWRDYGNILKRLQDKYRPDKTWGAVVGDACDMNTHGGAGLISHVRSDPPKMAFAVYQEWAGIFDRFWVVRGTEAHTGGMGELEETFAKSISATPDPQSRTSSWWHLKVDIAGVKFSVAHHPPTAGYLPYTRRSAVLRIANIEAWEYEDAGEEMPQVILRAHTHHYCRTPVGMVPMVVQLPAWQLTTSFGHRLGANRGAAVGGTWFLCEDGRVIASDVVLYRPERRPYWTEC